MTTLGLHSFSIPEGELERSSNWALAGSLRWSGKTRGQKSKLLARNLTSQILKIEATSKSTAKHKVKPNWYRAAYCHQLIGKVEAHSEIAILGNSYAAFPLAGQSYRLSVYPVQWLPNLTVKIWTYQGPLGLAGSIAGQAGTSSQAEWDWRSALPE